MNLSEHISRLLGLLQQGIYEKEEAMRLTLLSALAGESIFLLGKPGVAKSLIARRLKFAFKGGKAFEYLMNRFSTPDEIFGPVSISKLKDHDKYERVTRNYLPEADIVFLDEIWKAGPSIQNALLTVLNEKIYKNGEQEVRANIKAIISASNELPARNEGLEALWDRFLLRYVVYPISHQHYFNKMITDTHSVYEDNVPEELKIDDAQYTRWSQDIDSIGVSNEVLLVIHAIRQQIEQHNEKRNEDTDAIYVSDRRWRKIIRLLRASAFFNGREQVDLMDCFLITHCIWDTPDQWQWAQQTVTQAIQRHGQSSNGKHLRDALQHLQQDIENNILITKNVREEEPLLFDGKYYRFTMNSGLYKIDESDYERLQTNVYSVVSLYWDRGYMGYSDQKSMSICKGDREGYIKVKNPLANGFPIECKLETNFVVRAKKVPSPPHPALENEWDNQVETLLQMCLKTKNEAQKNLDNQSFKNNIFADARQQNIVEQNVLAAIKDIQQTELDIKKTQHFYKKITG